MTGGTRKFPGRQRGFILALLLVFVTVTGILLTKAMPSVVAEVQRDQEEELIFRGEAIRTAMRRYKAKTGTYPTSLEDLVKVRPPILRRLYKDPMTAEGDWELITAVQAGATGNTTGLPIAGIHSRSPKDSFRIYQGKTLYSEWIFSASDDLLGVSSAPANLPAGLPAGLLPGPLPGPQKAPTATP